MGVKILKKIWSKTIETESDMMGGGNMGKTVMQVELHLQAPSLMVMWEKRLKMIKECNFSVIIFPSN